MITGIFSVAHAETGRNGSASNPTGSTNAVEAWYGADVQIDTLGDAALLFGDVRVIRDRDSAHIPLDPEFLDEHPGAPERNNAAHPGAPEHNTFRHLRSTSFACSPGDVITATVVLMSDPRSLANINHAVARITYDVSLIDSATGAVLIPMFHAALGAGAQTIPTRTFSSFVFSHKYVSAAYVTMRVRVENADTTKVGIEGLVFWSGVSDERGIAKTATTHHSVAQTPASLSISPNPAHAWTQALIHLPEPGRMRIELYDMLGRLAATTFEGSAVEGDQSISMNTAALPAGFYVVRVMLNEQMLEGKTIEVRK